MACDRNEMTSKLQERFESAPMRQLSAHDLDSRMQEVAEVVAELGERESDAAVQAVAERRPRWIEPAELVRIVHN